MSARWRETFAQLSLHRSSPTAAARAVLGECATGGLNGASRLGYDGLCTAQSGSTSPPSAAATGSENLLTPAHTEPTNPLKKSLEKLAINKTLKQSKSINQSINWLALHQHLHNNSSNSSPYPQLVIILAQLQGCYDAHSRPGSCQTLSTCQHLLEEQQMAAGSTDFQTFLGQSICGFDGSSFLVKEECDPTLIGVSLMLVILSAGLLCRAACCHSWSQSQGLCTALQCCSEWSAALCIAWRIHHAAITSRCLSTNATSESGSVACASCGAASQCAASIPACCSWLWY